jgi:hypothetical protein
MPKVFKEDLRKSAKQKPQGYPEDHADPLLKSVLLVDLVLVEKDLLSLFTIILSVRNQKHLNSFTFVEMISDILQISSFLQIFTVIF